MSGIKPEPFDTLFLDLDAPVDLAVNATILPAAPEIPAAFRDAGDNADFGEREIFVQCIAGSARWREVTAEPEAGADGHILGLGDGVILTVTRGRPVWFWGGSADTKVAVSAAAGAPVRETGFDQPTPAA